MFRWFAWLRLPAARPRALGARCEAVAEKHLRKQGYRVLGRNLRMSFGEVDLLAVSPDRKALVIVEVKGRLLTAASHDSLRPEVHVNPAKQRKLITLAVPIARRFQLDGRLPIRFDVIGIDLPEQGDPVIRHHEAAFTV